MTLRVMEQVCHFSTVCCDITCHGTSVSLVMILWAVCFPRIKEVAFLHCGHKVDPVLCAVNLDGGLLCACNVRTCVSIDLVLF